MAAVSFPHRIQIFILLYYSICCLHSPRATSLSFSSNFSQPGGYDAQNFSFQGDAYYDSQSQTIELTKAGGSPNIQNSVGRALYAQPVPLWDAVTGELARFTTSFTFQIKVNGELGGDGMTFFLGHYPPTSIPDPLDNGRNLGLFNKSVGTVATGDDRAVAVEFDTFFNAGVDNNDTRQLHHLSGVHQRGRAWKEPHVGPPNDLPHQLRQRHKNPSCCSPDRRRDLPCQHKR